MKFISNLQFAKIVFCIALSVFALWYFSGCKSKKTYVVTHIAGISTTDTTDWNANSRHVNNVVMGTSEIVHDNNGHLISRKQLTK